MDLPPHEALSPAFRLEQFRDYLALEVGNSRHTVESYARVRHNVLLPSGRRPILSSGTRVGSARPS